jgi:hypothetical protein
MLVAWVAAQALAGDLYLVTWGPEAPVYERVATTHVGDGTITTWPDRPVELVVLADLSDSISGDEARRMGETMETLYEALTSRPLPGDRFGVTAFGSRTQRWIPVGALDRPGVDRWLERFGLPRAGWSGPASYGDEPERLPAPPDPRALDRAETDAARGLDAAIAELRSRDEHALKVIVLLWDGGHNGWGHLEGALDRAWAEEIHVWSVSFARPLGPLVTRGGGDAYVVADCGPVVAEKIVAELRFAP